MRDPKKNNSSIYQYLVNRILVNRILVNRMLILDLVDNIDNILLLYCVGAINLGINTLIA